jgi:hypothetical protein
MKSNPRMNLGRAPLWAAAVTACLLLGGAACVSPSTGGPEVDSGNVVGTGGQSGPGSGGSTGAGQGGSTDGLGGRGVGGNSNPGGQGGAPGVGGRISGVGGTIVGPGANFTDDFETGDVNMRWLAPQSNDSTPCGAWSVVAEGANHLYQQSGTCSNPSFAAGGSTDWVDMRLQVKVRFGASTSTVITIAVRYNSPKDLYWIEFTNDGRMKIRTRTATGSSVDVATIASNARVPVPANTWVTIGLGISGSTVSAYLGENRAAPPVLTGPASGQVKGGIGIGSSDGLASFDDVLVTPQ